MKQSKQHRRNSFSSNRNLRLERLESRTLMAAGLFSEMNLLRPAERLDTIPDIKPLFADVRAGQSNALARTEVVNHVRPIEPSTALAPVIDRFSSASVRVQESVSRMEVLGGVSREPLDRSPWSVATLANNLSVARPDFGKSLPDALSLNRILVREFDSQFFPVLLVAHNAEIDVAAVRRQVRLSDSLNIVATPLATAPSTLTAPTLLERDITIVAVGRVQTGSGVGIVSAPEALGRLMPISAYTYPQHATDISPLTHSLSDGGMIDLRVLPRSDRPAQAGSVQESRPWTIDAESVDRATRTATETMSPAASQPPEGAIADASDGGMIQIAAVSLPKSIPATSGRRIEIQLDPSIGHFRSFQLAVSPGHDRESGEQRMTLAWAVRDQFSSELDSHAGNEAENTSTRLFPLAYTGVVIVSSMMLTTEVRSRKHDANFHSLRRYSTGE